MEQTMDMAPSIKEKKPKKHYFSHPLFLQSIKSNWVLWLVLTLGSAAIFVITNLVVFSKPLFTNIDMEVISQYVQDEGMDWFQILGLLEKFGFKLNRIQIMSQIDLNAILNDLVYKIAGVLLPMIFVMITANKLVAAQVSDGSMAYVLSTPTNRKKVLRTQLMFLFCTIAAMYIVISFFAIGSEAIANLISVKKSNTASSFNFLKSFLFCFGSFCAMFALGGIAFGASCWFNKSTQSLAVGGGVAVISFLGCILGLFGNPVFVAVGVGVAAMSVFDYVSLFTLVDTTSMGNFAKSVYGNIEVDISYDWIWKLGVLIAIGVVFSYIGFRKFIKKDLPL